MIHSHQLWRVCFLTILASSVLLASESEVLKSTSTQVKVRIHPKTGKEFVSIVSARQPDQRYPFPENVQVYSRPDYRILDAKIKAGDIPYDGPFSSSKRIYIFAASMATAGTLSAVLAPVAATAGVGASAGGSAAPLLGSAAVVAATSAATYAATRFDSKAGDFIHRAEARLLDSNFE